MSAPTYPSSSVVVSGTPILAADHNQRRADLLYLGSDSTNAATLGAVLGRYSQWVKPQYLATNKIRIPYSAARPPALVVNGYLLKAAADVDSAAASGAAGMRYVMAVRTASSTTFTITVSATSTTEATDERLIGSFYWDGSNIQQGSIKGEEDVPQSGACAYHSTTQAVADDAAWHALALDSERWDTDAIHDLVTNNSRLTCVIAGIYEINGLVEFANNATGYRFARVLLNGATVLITDGELNLGASNDVWMVLAKHWRLAVGDYIELQALQNSGGSLNAVAAELSMELIR